MQKKFAEGMKNLNTYFIKKIETIKKINVSLGHIKLKIKDPIVWTQEFLMENEDFFDMVCTDNGWRSATEEYKKYLNDFTNANKDEFMSVLNSDLLNLANEIGIGINPPYEGNHLLYDGIVSGDGGVKYKLSKGLIYKTKKETEDWVEIKDQDEVTRIKARYFKEFNKKTQFEPELSLIYKEYPCLSPEKNNFEFLDGDKDYFYVSFKIMSGKYKDKEIYVNYNWGTDDFDYTVTYVDDNGYLSYFTDILKSEYNC